MAVDYTGAMIETMANNRLRREEEARKRKAAEPNWLGAIAGGVGNYFLGGKKDQIAKTALGALSGYLTPKGEYSDDIQNALSGGMAAYGMANKIDENRIAQEKAAREEAEAPLDKAVLLGKFLQSAKPVSGITGSEVELTSDPAKAEKFKKIRAKRPNMFYLPGVVPGVDWWEWQKSPIAAFLNT